MQPIHAHMPVELILGEGALTGCGPRAAAYGNRCLIITGGTSAEKSGALRDALASMKTAGVEAVVFPHISANPTLMQCRQAAEAAEALRAYSILAIGGGSVMDAAKAAAVMVTNFMPDPNRLFEKRWKHRPLPLMLCGTTAGTGSEVSAVSVITDMNGTKRSVKHPDMFAACVFGDPRYTDSMPRTVTVSTALDALAHTVEGFLNPSCDALSSLYAVQCLPLLMKGLTSLCNQELPTKEERDALYLGSLYAGMVLCECGTAFPHPMGYVLTEDYAIPHGQACAVFLPALLSCAAAHAPDRLTQLYDACGGEETLYHVLDTLTDVSVTMTADALSRYAVRFADLPHYTHVPGGFDGKRAVSLCRELFFKE